MANSYAEYYGASLPPQGDVALNVVYGAWGNELTGLAEFSGDSSPDTNDVIEIYQGDSYDDVAHPVKSFDVSDDYTGWTGVFTIRHRVTNDVLVTVSTVTVQAPTMLKVTLSATNTAFTALTSNGEFGAHPFDIEMTSGSSKETPVWGQAIIRRAKT